MTEQKRAPNRSKATPVNKGLVEHEDVLETKNEPKQPKPDVEKKTPTPRKRTPAAKKPVTPPPVEKQDPPPVTDGEGLIAEGDELLTPEDKKTDLVYGTEDVAAEVAVEHAVPPTELPGSENYRIDSLEDSVNITLGEGEEEPKGQYPMGVYARNPATLNTMVAHAVHRTLANQPRPRDQNVINYGEENGIALHDPKMMHFYSQENAHWMNGMVVDGKVVRSTRVRYGKAVGGGGGVDVSRLTSVIMRRSGLGSTIMSRLFHSGLICVLDPISKAERVMLVAELNEAHLDTLRRTAGLVHGTNKYYANRIIINAYLRNMSDCNLDRSEWDKLWQLIDHRDIQLMAAAIQAGSYQRGYQLIETCGAIIDRKDSEGNPLLDENGNVAKTTCGETRRAWIDFNLMIQVNQPKFTDWQKRFMLNNVRNKVTVEEIKRYQSEGEVHGKDYVDVADGVALILKAPTIDKHVSVGEEWIHTAEAAIDRAIATSADEDTRNAYIEQQLEAASVKDVLHWVVGVAVDGEELYIDDESQFDEEGVDPVNTTLVTIFQQMANNPQVQNDVLEKIQDAIINRLGAVPGIPTYTCSCGTLSSHAKHNGTAIFTPIDMVTRFFTLTAHSQ